MNEHECPDCESELHLCRVHQKVEIAIDEQYARGSLEWYEAMKEAELI